MMFKELCAGFAGCVCWNADVTVNYVRIPDHVDALKGTGCEQAARAKKELGRNIESQSWSSAARPARKLAAR